MGTRFWIRRFAMVATGLLVVIFAAHMVRGRAMDYAFEQALAWSLISALVFTVSRYFQARRGQHCAICNDTPDSASSGAERRD